MRAIFSILGLPFVLLVLGFLVKNQLSPLTGVASANRTGVASQEAVSVSTSIKPQQIQQALEAAVQSPPVLPEDPP